MNKKYKTKVGWTNFQLSLLPISIVLGLLPLIVRVKMMTYDTSELGWYANTTHQLADIFTYYKSILLIVGAVFMILTLIVQYLNRTIVINHKLFSPVYAYLLLTIGSTIFSISIYYSTKGFINHIESVFVLIAYMIVFVYTTLTIKSEENIQHLILVWMASITILTLIGLTQFLGHDLFRTDFGLDLIVPGALKPYISNVEFTLFADNVIYQTLFHYNYVSFYSATAFPFFIALVIGIKHIRFRLLYAAVAIMLLFNLLASQGRNGFIGLFIGSLLVLLLYASGQYLTKITFISISALVAISVCVVIFTDSSLENRMRLAYTNATTQVNYELNTIITDNENIYIDHDDFQLHIQASTNASGTTDFEFMDANNNSLTLKASDATYTILNNSDNDYTKLTLSFRKYKDDNVVSAKINNIDWHFVHKDNQMWYFTSTGHLVQLNLTPAIGFNGYERMGSARGYIWSRSLPVILNNPILGTGPDTYAIAFPQNDFVGKLNAYQTFMPTVDKPHNIYVNYASNTGIPSLVAILAIIFIGYYMTFINYFHSKAIKSNLKVYAIASVGSMTGYLFSGLFNDTSLHVTPLFWVIVGMNYALNLIATKK